MGLPEGFADLSVAWNALPLEERLRRVRGAMDDLMGSMESDGESAQSFDEDLLRRSGAPEDGLSG